MLQSVFINIWEYIIMRNHDTIKDLNTLKAEILKFNGYKSFAQYNHKEPLLIANREGFDNPDYWGIDIKSGYSVLNSHYTVWIRIFYRIFDDNGKVINIKDVSDKYYKFTKSTYEKYYQFMIDNFAPDYHPDRSDNK